MARRRTLGLALGGGAARGFAHIGVLKALSDHDIHPDMVAGTSAGSLVGALYCAGYSWYDILLEAKSVDWKDLIRPTIPTMGLFGLDGLESIIDDLVARRTIEQLPRPFRAVAVDLCRGDEVVFDRGSVNHAVRASCNVPGVFVPFVDADRVLVDGGLLNNVPADVVRQMGAEVVIGVNLNSDATDPVPAPDNVIQILLRSAALFMNATVLKAREAADLLIEPDLQGFAYHDLTRYEELVHRGEMATIAALEKIQSLLKGKK